MVGGLRGAVTAKDIHGISHGAIANFGEINVEWDEGFECFTCLTDLDAAGFIFGVVEFDPYGEGLAACGANGVDAGMEKCLRVGPLIGALVGDGGEELMDEVAMCSVELDGIEAGLFGARGGLPKLAGALCNL